MLLSLKLVSFFFLFSIRTGLFSGPSLQVPGLWARTDHVVYAESFGGLVDPRFKKIKKSVQRSLLVT